jgi:hypothetical protein
VHLLRGELGPGGKRRQQRQVGRQAFDPAFGQRAA